MFARVEKEHSRRYLGVCYFCIGISIVVMKWILCLGVRYGSGCYLADGKIGNRVEFSAA